MTATSGSSTSFCNSLTVLRGNDDAGHAFGACRRVHLGARQPVPVGRHRAQLQLAARLVRVQEDAVEIVARLFGRDRELRLFDEALQRRRFEPEDVRERAGGELREVRLRQALQAEARAARDHRHRVAVLVGLQHHLGAVGQLADDVVEQMRRHRRRAGPLDLGRRRLGHFEVEVGRLHLEACAVRGQQHVGQDRNGVSPLHHAMHMVERLQKIGAFEDNTHDEQISFRS